MQQDTAKQAANENQEPLAPGAALALEDVIELGNELKQLLVRSQYELIKGDAREQVEQLERWIESYRRGLAAALKISNSGIDMLTKAREQLALALDEQLRLEDEGSPSTKEQAAQMEGLAAAVRRMDKLIPVIEQSFHSPTNHAAA